MSFIKSDDSHTTFIAPLDKGLPEPAPDEVRRKTASGRWYNTIVALFIVWTRLIDRLPVRGFIDELQNVATDVAMLTFIYLAVKSWWMTVVSSRSFDTYILPAVGVIYLVAGIFTQKMTVVCFGLIMLLKKANDERYRSRKDRNSKE
jgi:hypothetical protein